MSECTKASLVFIAVGTFLGLVWGLITYKEEELE